MFTSVDERVLNGIGVLSAIVDSSSFAAASEALDISPVRGKSFRGAARSQVSYPSVRPHDALGHTHRRRTPFLRSDRAAGPFKSTVLVSDGSTAAPHTDPNLQNGWGIGFNPTGVMWGSANATSKATLYDGNGVVQSLAVTIPPPVIGQAGGPTGIVFNTSTDFQIAANGNTSNALFMWATEAGTIAGWSPKVLPTTAVIAYDDTPRGAVYKGLAIGKNGTENLLYATDFHNNKVDVFDKSLKKMLLDAQFKDPTLPAGFAPFGINVTGSTVIVTYAKVGPDGRKQVNGPGNGLIDTFDTDGHFIKRIATNGALNSPWGIAMAPANFDAASMTC